MNEDSTKYATPNRTVAHQPERLSARNLICFSTGTVGRDFLYQLFNSYLLAFILFTKHLTNAQFAAVSIIIIAARIFDAFNDPIMGGIVENTRTRWGKFKVWILIGAVLTGAVVISVFSVPLEGWAFIAFLAVMYFLFSITFTMNDISYWGMLPSLTSHEHDRSKLTSLANLCASAGIGLAGLLIPLLTVGKFALGGSSVRAYALLSIFSVGLMLLFQSITLVGVKEKPLSVNFVKNERLSIKQMFKTIAKNDQLLWCALILIVFSVGTNVVGGGLSMTYIYFEFGYNGSLLLTFSILFAIISTVFTIFYPMLSKKFGRKKLLTSTVIATVMGFGMILLSGLFVPSELKILKFALMTAGYGFAGWGQGFYLIMFISLANTVEYNEWKTGKREEGLIFSLRPFTAKLSSALTQFVVMLIYLAVGVTQYTNGISDLENASTSGAITDDAKVEGIKNLLNNIPNGKKTALLVCMCVIPIVLIVIAYLIYRKKIFLDEATHAKLVREIAERSTPGQ